jgi:hypothetical protein
MNFVRVLKRRSLTGQAAVKSRPPLPLCQDSEIKIGPEMAYVGSAGQVMSPNEKG